jgi:hypothetical protein
LQLLPFRLFFTPLSVNKGPQRDKFLEIYGRFEELGLLDVGPVFHWRYEFGLDVLLGIPGFLISQKIATDTE